MFFHPCGSLGVSCVGLRLFVDVVCVFVWDSGVFWCTGFLEFCTDFGSLCLL